jgi:uncharacterized Zn ribbon protein
MSAFTNSLASSLLASSILISGVTPVLAQYSCPPREIQSVHEVGDLKFELQGCQRSGKKVTCSVWVTNTSKDTSGYVRVDSTRLVDTAGEQYKSSVRSNISLSLVKDVPIKISATFMDVPTSVQDIALFEIDTNLGGNFKGQLRNLKITESKIGTSPSPIKKKK